MIVSHMNVGEKCHAHATKVAKSKASLTLLLPLILEIGINLEKNRKEDTGEARTETESVGFWKALKLHVQTDVKSFCN